MLTPKFLVPQLNSMSVPDWWQTPTGRGLAIASHRALSPWIKRLNPSRVMQLGFPSLWDARMPVEDFWLLCDTDYPALNRVSLPVLKTAADPCRLPFDAGSFDLVVLPYQLERSVDPYQVLKECYRVLAPEGYLVVLAFNPHSLFSLMRHWQLWRGNLRWPWQRPFIPVGQMRRLLMELGFEMRSGKYFQYRLPLLPVHLQARSEWLEFAGDRWWPTGANAYMLLAQRREPGWIPPGLLNRGLIPVLPAKSWNPVPARGWCRDRNDEVLSRVEKKFGCESR